MAWDGDSQRIIAVGDGRERFGHCITADSGNSVGEISGHSSIINSVSIRQQRPLRAATGADDSSMVFLHGAPFKFNSKVSGVHKVRFLEDDFFYAVSTACDLSLSSKEVLGRNAPGQPRDQVARNKYADLEILSRDMSTE